MLGLLLLFELLEQDFGLFRREGNARVLHQLANAFPLGFPAFFPADFPALFPADFPALFPADFPALFPALFPADFPA